MKGRPKSVVIRRQALPKPTSTYNQQSTSSLSKRSVVSPHYKKARLVQTEPAKNEQNSVYPHFHSVVKNPRLESLRETVEDSGSFENVSDDELTLLLAHTREYQQTCAAERKYEKANDAKELLEVIKEEMKRRQEKIRPDEDAILKVENDKKQKIEYYKELFDQHNKETKKRQQEIEDNQAKVRKTFEDKWANLMPSKYQKSSASLLQLKEIEKKLILTGDYLKAKETQGRIQQAAKAEMELRQLDLNEDYAVAKAELIKKQQNEIDVFLQGRKEQIETFDVQRKNDMQMMENRKNVASQKSIGTRCPRSTNKSSTDNYATSFQHIAKEKKFGIDPLLPKLGPPSDKRQYRIKNSKPKRIIVNAPRAYLPKNDQFFDSSDDQNPVFETSLKHSQLKGTEDDNDYDDNNFDDEQKNILQDQIDEISKSLNAVENDKKHESCENHENSENDINDENDEKSKSDISDKNENIVETDKNENIVEADKNENIVETDKNAKDEKGILENVISSFTDVITKDSGQKNEVDEKTEEKKEEETEEKKEAQPFHLLISSIVGNADKKDD